MLTVLSICALLSSGGQDCPNGDQSCAAHGKPQSIRAEVLAIERMLQQQPPALEEVLPRLVDLAKRKPKHRKANVYSALNMHHKAEKHLRKLVKITGKRIQAQTSSTNGSSGKYIRDYADSSYMLAKHLLRVKAPQKQIMHALEVTLGADPSHDNAKHWLAHQLSRSPDGESRAAELLGSIDLDRLTDNHPLDTLMLLGQAEERLGHLPAAVAAFRRSSDLYRKEATQASGQGMADKIRFRYGLAHFQLCRLLLLLGGEQHAAEAVQAALWATREFPPVYQITDVLSIALATVGRLSDAKANYREKVKQMKHWPQEWKAMPERVFGSTLAWILERSRQEQEKARADGGNASASASGDAGALVGSGSGSGSGSAGSAGGAGGAGASGWDAMSVDLDEAVRAHTRRHGAGAGAGIAAAAAAAVAAAGAARVEVEPDQAPALLSSTSCNIDRRDSLTREQFLREYVHRNKPVILRNERFVPASNSSSGSGGRGSNSSSGTRWLLEGWPALRRWRRADFLASYGDVEVEVRPSSYVAYDNEFGGMPRRNMSFTEYHALWHDYTASDDANGSTHTGTESASEAGAQTGAEAGASSWLVGAGGGVDTPYLLSNEPLQAAGVRRDYTEPRLFASLGARGANEAHRQEEEQGQQEEEQEQQAEGVFAHTAAHRNALALFYAGPALSGVSLHQHTAAWNALVHGRKRWYLLPPYALHGPTGMPMLAWLGSRFYAALSGAGGGGGGGQRHA